MYYFCTQFDKNYLYKGLTLYFSLLKHCESFCLYILCMDDATYCLINKMNLKFVMVIKMSDFESTELLSVKLGRSPAEYAWTCTSNLCVYTLEKFNPSSIAYLDADLFFYNSPDYIYNEIKDSSIGIIEHRFSPETIKLADRVGRFNVGLVYFKNDAEGLRCAKKWAKQVIEWCYSRCENGKYGDQKYLDSWPVEYTNLCILKQAGVGLAPWNLKSNFKTSVKGDILFIDSEPLIFYHFHQFNLVSPTKFYEAVGYFIPKEKNKFFYSPYIKAMKKTINFVRQYDQSFNFGYRRISFKSYLMNLAYNVIVPDSVIFILTGIKQRLAKLSQS